MKWAISCEFTNKTCNMYFRKTTKTCEGLFSQIFMKQSRKLIQMSAKPIFSSHACFKKTGWILIKRRVKVRVFIKVCVFERERERERMGIIVGLCICLYFSVCVCVGVGVRERDREKKSVCV